MNWGTFDIIDFKKRDLSFKNVMRIIALMDKKEIQLDLLDCDTQEEYIAIYNWLIEPRWENSKKGLYDNLTNEEKESLFKSMKTFDYLMDYDAYWCDFFSIGIDLEKDDIDFIRFGWLLENKFMTDENSAISNRIRMRTYKANKHDSNEYKMHMYDQKRKYAFSVTNSDLQMYENLKNVGKRGDEIGRNTSNIQAKRR